jgi:hypothetical protein
MSAKPQHMTDQNDDPDDLIAELSKLMASDARDSSSAGRAAKGSDENGAPPPGGSQTIRIPGVSEPVQPSSAAQPRLVANWQDRAAAGPSPGAGQGAAERREPSFGADSAAVDKGGANPSGFEFDFGFNQPRAEGPTSPAVPPKPVATQSTAVVPAAPSHDLIADLIQAELDQAMPMPANGPKGSERQPSMPARLPPAAQQPLARHAEVHPAAGRSAATPAAASDSDRFVTAPVFGLGNRPAGEQGASRPTIDPIDEIENLIGEAVRVELNAPPAAPSFARESAGPAEPRPAVPPKPAQFAPRRSNLTENTPPTADSPEDAILAAAAVSGAEVGRVESDHAGDRPAPGLERRQRVRAAREPRGRSGFVRSFVVPVAAGVVLVALGFGLYWGLGYTGGSGGKVPVLAASATPAKTIPLKPVPKAPQSAVMQELSGTTPPVSQETLVSRDQTAGATPAQVATPTPKRVADADNGLANRKVRTVTVRPDGTIVEGGDSVAGGAELPVNRPNVPAVPGVSAAMAADTPPSATSVPSVPAATTPAAPNPATAIASVDPAAVASPADPNAPMPMARDARPAATADDTLTLTSTPSSPVNAAVQPAATGKPLDLIGSLVQNSDPAPSRQVASTDTAGAAAHVQLASQASEAAAETTLNNLVRRYGSLFNGVRPSVIKADVSGRGTHYRVVIPAASLSGAEQLCSAIKAKGGDCFAYSG